MRSVTKMGRKPPFSSRKVVIHTTKYVAHVQIHKKTRIGTSSSVISTDQARFMAADICNMYFNIKLPSPEYMWIHKKLMPAEIISEYDVMKFTDDNGYAYVEIMGAIYGLAKYGYLAHHDLIKNLKHFGYFPSC